MNTLDELIEQLTVKIQRGDISTSPEDAAWLRQALRNAYTQGTVDGTRATALVLDKTFEAMGYKH